MVGEEIIQLNALSEVLVCLHASDVLQHIEVSVNINACSDQSLPVNALQLDVGVVLLELEVDRLTKVNIRSLDGVHIFSSHLELREVVVLGEYLHIY